MEKNNFRPLFSVFSKIDYRDKEHNSKKKLTGILLAYLVSNSFLAYTYNLIFDEQSFIIMTITASMFLITFIAINDFDNLFLANKSFNVLNSLPLNNTGIFSAKFVSGFLYLLFFFISIVIPQVIFFVNFEPSLSKIILFIVINFTFSFTAAGIFLLIYIFTIYKFIKRAGTLIILMQFLFFLFVIFSATLPSSSVDIVQAGMKRSILENDLISFTPQYFYSMALENYLYTIPVFLFFIAVYGIIYKFVSLNYLSLLERINIVKNTSSGKSRKFRFDIFTKIGLKIFKNKKELFAGYKLSNWQIKNSRFLKIKYIPMIFLPVIFAAAGFALDIPGLLIFKENSSSLLFPGSLLMMGPTISVTLIMSSRLLISNTKILDEHSVNTKWIYESLPLKSVKGIVNGANGFIYFNYILPAVLFVLFLLIIKAGIIPAVINIFYISAAILFINSVFNLFNKDFPFTLDSNKFNSASKLLELILSVIAGVIIFIIQFFIFQNIIFVLMVSLLFITVSYFLNRN